MNFLIVLFLFLANFGQGPPVDLENVPLPVSKCLQQTGKVLEVNRVLVQDRKSKKEGFAFCFAGRPEGHVVGAGNSIAVEGGVLADDFSELDNWGVADGWSTRPRRDGVYVGQI